MRTGAWLRVVAALAASGVGLAGCASGSESGSTITVSAASSLTEPFGAIAEEFENENPGVEVQLSFASSSSLATQIEEGAPADVFASADRRSMQRVVDVGLASAPEVFAHSTLAVAVKPGNPRGVRSLEDLTEIGVVALCAPEAPCGRLADTILSRAGVQLDNGSVTRAPNVKATLTAVAEGDAAAAIVYVTDVWAAGDAVERIEIPAERNIENEYPIAVVDGADPADVARDYVEFVVSEDARAILAGFGFQTP